MKYKSGKLKTIRRQERGVAFITALMVMILLGLLGTVILLSATGDTIIATNYRRSSQAFSASDAGIGLAREEMRLALLNVIQARSTAAAATLVYPPTRKNASNEFDETQLTQIIDDPNLIDPGQAPISTVMANLNARLLLYGNNNAVVGGFTPQITLEIIGPPVIGPRPAPIAGVPQPPSSVSLKFRYTITSIGNNNPTADAIYQRTRTNSEQGVFNLSIHPVPTNATSKVFSEYGAFYGRSTGGNIASGTFRGPVHSNDYFSFGPDNHVIFLEKPTWAGAGGYQYWDTSAGNYAWKTDTFQYDASSNPTVEFRAGFEQVAAAQMPTNVYSQERAVIDAVGDSTAVTKTELIASLRSAFNSAPGDAGSTITNGVYVSSTDGSSVTGGGIYVQGDVDDLQMSASGTQQVVRVTQGGVVTTITITPPGSSSAGSTTISNGSSSTNFSGVPMDKSNALNQQTAAMLFVKGNLNGLHGPAVSGTQTGPAVNSAFNITSSGDITITGDLKYQDQVMDANGDPLPGWETTKNVLGVFTNSGKITIRPSLTNNLTASGNMFIDAALMAFNEPAIQANPNADTGGVAYDGVGFNDIFLRGSRAQSKGLAFLGNGRRSDFFDPRFRNGSIAPPFAPQARITTSMATTAAIYVASGATLYNTWQRIRR